MTRLFIYLNKYRSCASAKKKEIIQIISSLFRAKFLVYFIPLKYYHYNVFVKGAHQTFDLQLYHKKYRLFKSIYKSVPIHFTCLEESLALQMFLRKNNAILPIYLGIKSDINGKVSAHAWTQFEDFQVEEYKKLNQYEINRK